MNMGTVLVRHGWYGRGRRRDKNGVKNGQSTGSTQFLDPLRFAPRLMRKLATGIAIAVVAAALRLVHSIAVGADALADECWEAKVGLIERSSLPVGYGPMKFDREGNLYCWSNCYPAACGFTLTKVTRDLQRAWEITRTPELGFAALALADCTTDSSGRVFLTGWSATNGATSVQQEIFVWCYDRDGTALWTNRYTSEGLPHGIGADAEGNVYLVSTTSEGANKPPGFIELVKLNAAGERCWRTLYDGPSHEGTRISSIATGPGGMVCFGLGRAILGRLNVVAYGDDGRFRWVTTLSPLTVVAHSVVVDSAGDVVVEVQQTSPGGSPHDRIYVEKLGSDGQQKWSSGPIFYTSYGSQQAALHVDGSNNVYCAAASAFVSPSELNVLKLEPAGRPLWWIRFDEQAQGDAEFSAPMAICRDSDGNVRIAGSASDDGTLVVARVMENTALGRPVTVGVFPGRLNRRFESLGSTIELNTLISGSEPLFYQWRRNGADIPGATNASLFITNAADSDSGLYQQVVRNPFGCSLSTELTLYVSTPPAPQLADVRLTGSELSFMLNGRTNIQYQVETSTDLQHWTWCCSQWAGPVSMARPPGDSVFVRVGIYVPTAR